MFGWSRDQKKAGSAPASGQSAGRRLIAVLAQGRAQWTPRDYSALAREGFARNAIAYRCIRMIAEAAASVPLEVRVRGRRAGDSHPLRQLIEQPNPEQGGADLREQLYGALQTAGNAYIEAVGDLEQPAELWALRPDRMQVVPGARGWPEAYDYRVGGQVTRIRRDRRGWLPVLHLKLFHPLDDWYGFSPLEAAAFAIDVHNASGAWNKALLDNAARPSGALVYGRGDGSRLTEAQFQALRTELQEAHAGAANAGRPMLLEGGLEWTPMALSPADMDFIAGKHAAAREIALAFGVPPQLLGIPGDNTYATYKEAQAAFWRTTIGPLADKTARALGGWLAQAGGPLAGASLRPDLDQVAALSPERDALWQRAGQADFLSDAEKRAMVGLAPERSA